IDPEVWKQYTELTQRANFLQSIEDFEGCKAASTEMVELLPEQYEGWAFLAMVEAVIIENLINENKFNDDTKLEEVDTYFENAYKFAGDKDVSQIKQVHAAFLKKNLLHACDVNIADAESKLKELTKKQAKAKPKAKPKTPTVQKVIKTRVKKSSKEEVLIDPDPIKFPSDFKVLRIIFWILFGFTCLFTAVSIGILFFPSMFTQEALQNVTFAEITYIFIVTIATLTLTISWIVFYLIRRFKRVDCTKPVVFKVLRYIFVSGFLIFAVLSFCIGTVLVLYQAAPTLFEGSLSQATIENIDVEYLKLKIYGIIAGVCLIALIIEEFINHIRLDHYLKGYPKVKVLDVFITAFDFLMIISFVSVILFGIVSLVNLIVPDLAKLIFADATANAVYIMHTALWISAAIFGGALITFIILSMFNKEDTIINVPAENTETEPDAEESTETENGDDNAEDNSDDENKTMIYGYQNYIKLQTMKKENWSNLSDEETIIVAQKLMKKNANKDVIDLYL
ncbi:MAG: hypothetical protein IJZ26_00335, partial [Clostridia bacterium]|nr:hypothetical protein [Clostridia bacterium]